MSLILPNAYLPASYDLHLAVGVLKPNFLGKVVVPLQKNALCVDPPKAFSLTLHAHKLVITKAIAATANGPLQLKVTHSRADESVTFSHEQLEAPLSIEIDFVGSITAIKTFRDETYGVFKTNYSDSVEGKSDNYVIATHCQPFGARSIFPTIDELTWKVPLKLTITTQTLFKVFSNAALEDKSVVEMSDTSIYRFKPTPPIAPSVFGFVIGDFETIENTLGRVPVRVLTTRGDSSRAQYALLVASALLPELERLFDVPYPLDKFDLVTLPFLSDSVMENWGMVTAIRETILMDPIHGTPDEKKQVRQLIAHQLTHQWIGNFVTFDDWKYTWLVEAFATWVGNYLLSVTAIEPTDRELYLLEKLSLLQDFMDSDCFYEQVPSLHEHMSGLDISTKSRTNTIFEKNAYDKGMILINMIAALLQIEKNELDYTAFFKGLSLVLRKYAYQTIKPFDMWGVMNESTSFELMTFVHSWLQYPGFPLLTVTVEKEKIKIRQSRFLYNDDADELKLENQPFHVPLAMRVLSDDGKVKTVNLILSDRSTELDISPQQFISLNACNQFYYKTVYSRELEDILLLNIASNRLTPLDLVGLVKDYGKILGQPSPKTNAELFGANQLKMLLSLCDTFAGETWNVDFEVLKAILPYLEFINTVFVHFTEYTKFAAWLGDFSLKLFHKIGHWDDVVELQSAEYNPDEFEVRNVVLALASNHKESQTVCRKLYKNFVNSGVAQKFIPRELFSLMFNVTMATATMAEYKQVLTLVKNANVSYLKHTNATAQDIQTAAVSSLSFCTKRELLTKTLHFVNTNIDSKLIELALIGYKYKHDDVDKQVLWAWYKVNYDLWIKRSLRKGSDWAKQIGITCGNITRLVLGEVMQYKPEEAKAFVASKLASLPPHQLQERVDAVELENDERRAIAIHYGLVV